MVSYHPSDGLIGLFDVDSSAKVKDLENASTTDLLHSCGHVSTYNERMECMRLKLSIRRCWNSRRRLLRRRSILEEKH